jgi:type I restriction enzyme R subunit
MPHTYTEDQLVEQPAIGLFAELGYAVGHGPHLATGEPAAERDGFGEVVQSCVARTLIPTFFHGEKEKREAIRRLNPAIPEDARATIRQFRLVRFERRQNP